MPKCIRLLIFALDKLNVLILLFDGLIERLLLIFVVDYGLLVSAHSLLKLSLAEAHLGVAVRQEMLEPLVFNLELIELQLLLLQEERVVILIKHLVDVLLLWLPHLIEVFGHFHLPFSFILFLFLFIFQFLTDVFIVEQWPVIRLERYLLKIVVPVLASPATFESRSILRSLLAKVIILIFEHMEQIVVEEFLQGGLVLDFLFAASVVLGLLFVRLLGVLVCVD